MKNFLAIDQGTTSSRAIVFNSNLQPISESQKEYDLSYPNDGWVELDISDVLNSVKETVTSVLSDNLTIEACGITNQRETTVVWSKSSGEAIYPAIVWQDRRTHEYCNKLKLEGHEESVRNKTGLVLDPYFSATKIKWILDNVEGAKDKAEKGDLLFGTIDTYLIYKLTGDKNHLTDVTNASRTMLFNINTLEWDKELLDLFEIPESMLPKVLSCDDDFGNITINNQTFPIKGVIGDQQAALVGQRCIKKGDMKSTYGTGCFLMLNTEEKPISIDEGLLTTIAYSIQGKTHYAIEGSIYSCGNIIKWLRDKMNFFETSKDSENYLNENGETNNVLFLPAFNGLGAPYWNSDIRAGFYGITQDSSVNDMVTACFNSIAFQTKEIIMILEKYDIEVSSLLVDGGMVQNSTFCKILANSIQKVILRPQNVESTAVGACIVAMLASGENLDDIKVSDIDLFETDAENIKENKKKYEEWRSYLSNTMNSK